MGLGLEFANYMFQTYLEPLHTVDVAAQIAAYVIGVTKRHVTGVGHGTDVHMIYSDGIHWSIHKPEIESLESGFGGFFETLRHAFAFLDSQNGDDAAIGRWCGLIGDGIRDLRVAHASRLETKRRVIGRGLGDQQQHPQPTTGDQSPQPPSQE